MEDLVEVTGNLVRKTVNVKRENNLEQVRQAKGEFLLGEM